MIFTRTTSDNADFRALVVQLDEYLAEVDGEEHAYYAQFNGLDKIPNAVVAYDGETAIGCGALRAYSDDTVEIKRMFVLPALRGKRIAVAILEELEAWARDLKFSYCILETGQRQKSAIRLYERSGYQVIPNYGQYTGVYNSICMKKSVSAAERAEIPSA